jgi:glycosyltransferase involved in cell wall biosynthesis
MTLAKSFAHDTRSRLEALALRRSGYDIEVLAWDRDLRMPLKATVDGIRTTSVKIFRGVEFRKLKFALASVIFQIACFFYALRLCRAGKLIVHAHDFNTLLPGALAKLVFRDRISLVYDSHEYTPGVYAEWYGSMVGTVAGVLERLFGRYCDALITVSDPMADYLERTLGRACTVLWNCPPLRDIPTIPKDVARAKLNLPARDFIVSLIAGSIRVDSRLDIMQRVADLAQRTTTNIRFLVVGAVGALALSEHPSSVITVVGRVSHRCALMYRIASDLTWAIYADPTKGVNTRIGLPWQVFESMACAVPVMIWKGTHRATLVNKVDCGVAVDGNDPEGILECIHKLSQNSEMRARLSVNARSASLLKYNWEHMSDRLIRVYESLVLRSHD